jgi:hypothetical protein
MPVEVTSNIIQVKAALADAKQHAMDVVGKYIRGNAVLLCPVDTDELRGSIGWRIDPQENHIIMGTDVEHGLFVELGTGIYEASGKGRQTPWAYYYEGKKGPQGWRMTHGMRPKKFITKAILDHVDQISQLYSEDYRIIMDGKDK